MLGLQTPAESWLVELADTGEVLPVPPVTPVPLTRAWHRGLVNVRGNLYDVVDFSLFQSGEAIAPGGSARILLIGSQHGHGVALLFSRATGLRSPDEFTRDETPDDRPWVDSVLCDVQGHRWLKLDVANLVRTSSFLEADTLTT